MNTMFDVGDEIEFKVVGKISEYSCSKVGDYYTLSATIPNREYGTKTLDLYFSTEAMKTLDAHKKEERSDAGTESTY